MLGVGGDEAGLVGVMLVEVVFEVSGRRHRFLEEGAGNSSAGRRCHTPKVGDHFGEVAVVDFTQKGAFLPDGGADVEDVGFGLISGGDGGGRHVGEKPVARSQ